MKRLYIIGNGFDLYHGIKSRYSDFGIFLKERDSLLYSKLLSLIGSDDLWSTFENNLADLDINWIIEEFRPNVLNESFKPSEIFVYEDEMEQQCDELTEGIKEVFNEWICELEIESLEKIDIVKSASFLNFNYTNSLEDIYQIESDKILYIHGKADRDDIILGHGTQPNICIDDPRERHLFSDAEAIIKGYYWRTFKNTQEIITTNKSFFQSLKPITKIYILGHSLSTVDYPYFTKISENIDLKNVKWIVTYYNYDEYDHHYNALKNLDIPENNIQLIKMAELCL